jgi:hypothetical protein
VADAIRPRDFVDAETGPEVGAYALLDEKE